MSVSFDDSNIKVVLNSVAEQMILDDVIWTDVKKRDIVKIK